MKYNMLNADWYQDDYFVICYKICESSHGRIEILASRTLGGEICLGFIKQKCDNLR